VAHNFGYGWLKVWCVAVDYASELRDVAELESTYLHPHTTSTTSHNQSYVPHAVNSCVVSTSWWWA